MILSQFDYISKEESERLIHSIPKLKHKTITLLMLDAGLRVSEAISLQLKNFNFKRQEINVYSLKKRQEKSMRTVPISNRLLSCLADHIHTLRVLEPDTYLFPSCNSQNQSPHVDRTTVFKMLRKYGGICNIARLHPHTLRHTFATHHLASGTSLPEIKTMLGHKSYNTTLIYAQVPTEQLKERVNAVTSPPPSLWSRLLPKRQTKKLVNIDFTTKHFIVGRSSELQVLDKNANLAINTVVVGDIGVGKSYLIDNIKTDKKILSLDDDSSFKKSVANMLLALYQNKNKVMELLYKDLTADQAKKRIQRESVQFLCDQLIQATDKHQYIITIDDISRITPGAKKGIERLANHFVIICGARQVKASDTSFLWAFEKLEIKPLNRQTSMILINQLSAGLEVENWETFRSHVYDNTVGNPRAMTEMIERYRKEPFLDLETIREIKHTGALPEIEMTWVVVLSLGVVMAMRYMSGELDQPAFRFIGGVAMILLLMYRPLMRQFKRSSW